MGINIYLAQYFNIINFYRFIVVLFFLCLAQRSPFLKLDRKAALVCTLKDICVFWPKLPPVPPIESIFPTHFLFPYQAGHSPFWEGPSLWDSLSFSSLFSVSQFLSLLWCLFLYVSKSLWAGRAGQEHPKGWQVGRGWGTREVEADGSSSWVGSVHCSVCQCWSHL